jgi:microcompartment protein CcmL/EutN
MRHGREEGVSMDEQAIGLVEFLSIARGIEATDEMVKVADVDLLLSRTVCSGKYITLIGGEVSGVERAMEVGLEIAAETLVDQFILANVHSSVIPSITATTPVDDLRALGVIETFSVAASIVAADTAVKAASVDLVEIRAAIGLGGKSFVILNGDVADITTAVKRGEERARSDGTLVYSIVIPAPRKELLDALL